MVSDGCVIELGAVIDHCVLSPGVVVESGAVLTNSIILTDCRIGKHSRVTNSILDKRVTVGEGASIGSDDLLTSPDIAMVGKSSLVPDHYVIEGGASVDTDVTQDDYPTKIVKKGEFIKSRREANGF